MEDLNSLEPLPASEALPLHLFNSELGQSFVRSDWTKDAHSFVHTCRSPIQNQHAHIDLLSFEYIALNKNIICDPGLYSYKESEKRREFKSTASHSTVMLNHQDHFEYRSTWGYGPQQKGELDFLKEGKHSITSHGYHESYKPTVVERYLSLVDHKFLLVIDSLSNRNESDTLARTFHLDYKEIRQQGQEVEGLDQEVHVKIFNYPFQEITVEIGKLSDINDLYRESRKIIYTSSASIAQNYITVLYPYRSDLSAPNIQIEEIEIGMYRITEDNKIIYQVQINEKDINILKIK
ncbi:heparinase II/III-family protein [Jeotgalibaca sp. MA1X17-3]|nr:heparinase II/III-family protein [Jeotgalibaca sp. MA1X17-3]